MQRKRWSTARCSARSATWTSDPGRAGYAWESFGTSRTVKQLRSAPTEPRQATRLPSGSISSRDRPHADSPLRHDPQQALVADVDGVRQRHHRRYVRSPVRHGPTDAGLELARAGLTVAAQTAAAALAPASESPLLDPKRAARARRRRSPVASPWGLRISGRAEARRLRFSH